MPKFTNDERKAIENIVATLSIKRIPDSEIIEEIKKIDKKISGQSLYNVRQRVKKDSHHWYKTLREGKM